MKNDHQKKYSAALAAYKLAELKKNEHERSFLSAKGVVDRRGWPALHIWQVDDDDLFDRLDAEYQADPQAVELWNQYAQARIAFLKSEKALVEWALSIVPADVQNILEGAAETDGNTRQKIIDLALLLDASTIPADAR